MDAVLAVFSVGFSLGSILLLVGLGWFLVWKVFLSRFRFVRELIGSMTDSSSVNELKNGRSRLKKPRKE